MQTHGGADLLIALPRFSVQVRDHEMGFQLWIDGDLAWAQGTYEYRPMGVAVISTSDLFRRRDFRPRRRVPTGLRTAYAGHFASIGHLNAWLIAARRMVRPAARANKTGPHASPG